MPAEILGVTGFLDTFLCENFKYRLRKINQTDPTQILLLGNKQGIILNSKFSDDNLNPGDYTQKKKKKHNKEVISRVY